MPSLQPPTSGSACSRGPGCHRTTVRAVGFWKCPPALCLGHALSPAGSEIQEGGGGHLQKGPACGHFLPRARALSSSFWILPDTLPGTRLGAAAAADQAPLLPLLLPGAAQAGLLARRPLCVCDSRASGGGLVALCALGPGGPGPGPVTRGSAWGTGLPVQTPLPLSEPRRGGGVHVLPPGLGTSGQVHCHSGAGQRARQRPSAASPFSGVGVLLSSAGSLVHLELPLVYGVRQGQLFFLGIPAPQHVAEDPFPHRTAVAPFLKSSDQVSTSLFLNCLCSIYASVCIASNTVSKYCRSKASLEIDESSDLVFLPRTIEFS